ncbi:C45 family autoproteolytic acyltransferase/hydolase [Terribacillus halophilus]|uniref:C45 family autoproteolytic acyltransferase/hydolase n=1 Tax=Terribacillus halophilus TaxID=361279 RepID=UPI00398240DC
MKQIYSDVFTFRGSHYDFGFMQGERLKHTPLFGYQQKQKQRNRRRFTVDPADAFRMFRSYHPGIYEELTGLSDALGLSIEETLMDYSGFQQEWRINSGCSIVTGNEFLARNYDYHPKTYEGRFLLYQPSESEYFATIGPSQRILGRIDGMNEKGLTIGYNFVHQRFPEEGFICNMLSRILLETCTTTEEAVEKLTEMPHRHSFNYVINDADGVRRVVEGSPRGTAVKKAHYSTNHFDVLTKENRHHLVDSNRRFEIIKAHHKEDMDAAQGFRLLNDPSYDVFSDSYRNWAGTIHTSVYKPKKLKMGFAIGNQQPTEVDFGAWLRGKDLSFSQFTGSLDTDVRIPYMGE